MRRDHYLTGSQPEPENLIFYDVFANEVNQTYPNRMKHLHQNYSVNEDGLFYVTVEQGTSRGKTKTLVIGNKYGILKTKDVSIWAWGVCQSTPFAYHGYFGFSGRSDDNTGSYYYLSLFYYDGTDINNLYTGSNISLYNWMTAATSCFTYNNVDYFQCITNSNRNTFVFYNLTSHTTSITRNEDRAVGHINGAVITTDNDYIYYMVAPTANSTSYSLRINKVNSLDIRYATTISNTISTFNGTSNTIKNFPVINGKNKMLLSSSAAGYTDTYNNLTYSSDYSQLNVVNLRSFFSDNIQWSNVIIQYIQSKYDAFYCNNTNYDIVKVQNAFSF